MIRKNQRQMLAKLGIEKLTSMQENALAHMQTKSELILYAPTGTGKTLAFLLSIFSKLREDIGGTQALILVSARELAQQIEEVARSMGTGYKINAFYGGKTRSKDKLELKHPPTVLVGTPGRIADHIRRENIDLSNCHFLVLDEFDKSLEVGFEKEMQYILRNMKAIKTKMLTSATVLDEIPAFVGLKQATTIDYLGSAIEKLKVSIIYSPVKDKLNTLLEAICNMKNASGIIFCNFKDSIERVSNYLSGEGIIHGCYHGGLEQWQREEALIKFRNGTHHILLATDLAARGLDISELAYIIHYHLPLSEQEFIHRNGRTARMNKSGSAYVLAWKEEELPAFIITENIFELIPSPKPQPSKWSTLLITGGRKDKISKGDIVGMLVKTGGLDFENIANIELKANHAYIGISGMNKKALLSQINNVKLKKKKIKVRILE